MNTKGLRRLNLMCTNYCIHERILIIMIDKIALILAIVGGLNWGSIGIFKFDIVAWLCGGQGSLVARIIYTLVGLAAVWCISLLFRETDAAVEDDVMMRR